jgi:hypothetical protein
MTDYVYSIVPEPPTLRERRYIGVFINDFGYSADSDSPIVEHAMSASVQ